ncbi:MAG: cytochrome b [Reyranella sp.]|uniref:cytochrome b n=1 Tax=Reyranella sp. TaxID=1929291 RepID=UPI001209B64A|nr:cytochrome b/b6 domain-containing protein [Reyranella sp.]TAJ87974.1 MAG: cytochrome b [Reyranella sp.]TBR29925.1 MAG: cytochrome b [Reyranella sp.]
MQLRNSASGYGVVSRSLHWITVLLVLIAWLVGTFGDAVPKGEPRAIGLAIHIAAGLVILMVLALRMPWRAIDPPPLPPEPTRLGPWGDRASRLAHYTLYGLLLAVLVIGIAVQFARGAPLPLFGFAEITSPWTADRAFARLIKEVHEVLANALVILAALHAAAALIHHWVLHDRTLARMLPGGGK